MRRWDVLRVTAAALALVWILLLAAYVFAASSTGFTLGAVIAAGSALAIAGTGFLYAWREPASRNR